MIPYITEEVWGLLNRVAPVRGLQEPALASEFLVVAAWPTVEPERVDEALEGQFARFQSVLAALREIRSRQRIGPKDSIEFCVRCDAATSQLLQPMERYFQRMANASSTGWGQDVTPPKTNAKVDLKGIDVYVDLKDFIDVQAEIERNTKLIQRLEGSIAGKEKKLSNDNFVQRAPAEVVQRERASLEELQEQLQSVRQVLVDLRKIESVD
jgi:valyl-tRNA synthetase